MYNTVDRKCKDAVCDRVVISARLNFIIYFKQFLISMYQGFLDGVMPDIFTRANVLYFVSEAYDRALSAGHEEKSSIFIFALLP